MKKLIIIFLIVLSVLAYMQIKGWIAEGGPLLNRYQCGGSERGVAENGGGRVVARRRD